MVVHIDMPQKIKNKMDTKKQNGSLYCLNPNGKVTKFLDSIYTIYKIPEIKNKLVEIYLLKICVKHIMQ